MVHLDQFWICKITEAKLWPGNDFSFLAKPEVIQSLFLPRVVRELT